MVYFADSPRLRLPALRAQCPCLVSSLRAITVPRAPSPLRGVTPWSVTFLHHRPTLLDPLRSYGLMRQTKTLSRPRFVSLRHESLQVAAYPCWELAFPDVISSIFIWVHGPVPRRASPVHSLVSSRRTSASPQSKQVRRAGTSITMATSVMATDFGAAVIPLCSSSHIC